MILALVPLRGGSKSIPHKNIKVIAGKPLCAWTLESANRSGVFDKIVVSTDSDEIANVVQNLGLNIQVIMRPGELATDTASTESVMVHIMERINFDVLFTIQATSPLVTPQDFNKAFQKFKEEGLDSLVTGVRVKRFFWDQDGIPINYNPLNRPMRQDFKGIIMENGAFYITKRDILKQFGCRLGGKIGIYEMHKDTAIEVDEPSDWEMVEKQLVKRERLLLNERLRKVKMLIMDVDGVLTDGGMYYSESGDELKKFNARDGKGLELLRGLKVETAIVTSENTKIVERRSKKLKIDYLYQGIQDKLEIIKELRAVSQLDFEEMAYIGDDINDLSAINVVGVAACPNDAVDLLKNKVDVILTFKGGKGAVRQFCDMIIGAKIYD
jgi:YrbI family 3-deoxy-D-manno-octulosonate 8-phosphate phosphatase